MALLAGRSRLALARQGRELLEQKRDALLRELYRAGPVVYAASTRSSRRRPARGAPGPRRGARPARSRDGGGRRARPASARSSVEVESADGDGRGGPVRRSPRPRPDRPEARDRRRRGLRARRSSSPRVRFEEEVTIAIRVATMETRVRRLAREIRRTSQPGQRAPHAGHPRARGRDAGDRGGARPARARGSIPPQAGQGRPAALAVAARVGPLRPDRSRRTRRQARR